MRTFFGFILIFYSINLTIGQSTISPYPDNSPELSDWLAMGVTDPQQKWKAPDYKYAIDLFDRIYEADKFSLPRKNSPFSGAIYKRMLNRENFASLSDENVNFGIQIIDYEKVKGLGFRLLIYYIEDTEPEERFSAEVLDCLLLDAWLNLKGIILYDKLIQQLTPEQLSSSNFRRGFEQAARDYKRSMEEIFYVLEVEPVRYDREVLMEYAAEFGTLIQGLPDRKATDIFRYRLQQLAKTFPDKAIKKILKGYVI